MFPPIYLELVQLDQKGHYILFNFPYRRYYGDSPVKKYKTAFDNWQFTVGIPEYLNITKSALDAIKAGLMDNPKHYAESKLSWIILTPVDGSPANV